MKLPKNSTQASPKSGFTQVQMDKARDLVSRLRLASALRGASTDESVGSGSQPKPSLTLDMQKLYQKQIDDYVRWFKEEQDMKIAGVGGLGGGLGSGRSSIGSVGGVVDLTAYGVGIVISETGQVGKSDQREFVFKNSIGSIVGMFYGNGGDMIHIKGGTIPGLPECQLYVIPKLDKALYGGFRLEVSNQAPVLTPTATSNKVPNPSHIFEVIKANIPLLDEFEKQELYQMLYDMGCRIGKGIKVEEEVGVQREIVFKELMPEVR